MTFDDRLRGHLRRQASDVGVEGRDRTDPKRRAGRRRMRRHAGGFALVFAVLGVGAAWVAAHNDEEPVVEVATETERADETLDDPGVVGEGADEAASPELTAGDPLVFTEIDSEGAPGGFNLHTRGVSGQLYYVLSTAPGATQEEVYGVDGPFHSNDTLYTWRGDGWANTAMPDRFITTIGDAGGLLYTVSTGSSTGDGPAVGTSADGGASWTWTPLDLTAQFGADPTEWARVGFLSAAGPQGHLVVAWRMSSPDYFEALQLANGAGLVIDDQSHDVIGIDDEGIHYVDRGLFEMSCRGRAMTTTAVDVLDPVDDPTCVEFVVCQSVYEEWDREQRAATLDAYVDLGLLEPGQTEEQIDWSLIDRDMELALDEAMSEIWDGNPVWPDGANCEQELFGPGWGPDDVTSMTWAELGVVPPATWAGGIGAYLVDGDVVTELDVPFEPGWVQSVLATDDGFEVVIDERGPGDWRSAWGFGASDVPERSLVRWQGGPDGWLSTPAPVDGPGPMFERDGATYGLTWGERGESGIRRDTGGQSTIVSELALFGVDRLDNGIWDLQVGEYGIAAVAVDFVEQRSLVTFSVDGLAWASTTLDGWYVDGMIVGDDGVLVFAHTFDNPKTNTVFIGRQ